MRTIQSLSRALVVLVGMLFLGGLASPALAATKAELQERFKERLPQVVQAKQQGTIGETFAGYLDFVKADAPAEVKSLVEQENADRRELYQLIATETGTSAETVAQRNAKRNFVKAKSGEWLKGEDGQWKQKP